ncbi:MAG: ABC transporter substrate-binding protein [Candidatus Neomarinimicrobiota bacterium]
MNFNKFTCLSMVCLVMAIFTSCGNTQRPLTIGIAEFNQSPMNAETEKGVLDALRDSGYVAGQNVKFIIQNAQGDFPTVNAIARNFTTGRVDLICCLATPNLQNCLNLSKDVPIVFTSVANPFLAGAGRTETDHLPNVTGIATRSPFDETIAIIREILPNIKVIGTLYTPSEINSEYYLECQKAVAAKNGLTVIALSVNTTSELTDAANALASKKIDAIYQISDNLTNLGFEAIVKVANQARLPLFCNQTSEVERGAAVGVGWNFYEAGYEAGKIIPGILRGAKPADIPIKYMTGAKVTLNLPAARIQGLVIPQTIIDRADEVIR